MIPLPGPQNSIPYFFAADSRKSNTSLLLTIARYDVVVAISELRIGEKEECYFEICFGAREGGNEMIAVDGSRHGGGGPITG